MIPTIEVQRAIYDNVDMHDNNYVDLETFFEAHDEKEDENDVSNEIEVDVPADHSEVDQIQIGTTTRSGQVTVRPSRIVHAMML